jgi:hypothetical protein
VEEKGKTTDEKKPAIISAYKHTKLKLTVVMLLGRPQNTIKGHLVFTALFCFAPFSVFSSRMSAPYWRVSFSTNLPIDSPISPIDSPRSVNHVILETRKTPATLCYLNLNDPPEKH